MTLPPIVPRVRLSIIPSLYFSLTWELWYPMSLRRSAGMSAKRIGCIVYAVSMSLTNSAAFDFYNSFIDGHLSELLYVSLQPSGVRLNDGRSASYADSMNVALASRKADSSEYGVTG